MWKRAYVGLDSGYIFNFLVNLFREKSILFLISDIIDHIRLGVSRYSNKSSDVPLFEGKYFLCVHQKELALFLFHHL